MKPITSVDLIVVKNGKILLGKVSKKWSQNKYDYGLPGREIRFGENFKQCVERNLKEELGMRLKNYKIICMNNNFGFGNHYVTIGIFVHAEGEPIIKSDDWLEWRWFDKNKIPKKLFPSAKLTIKCYLENKITVE